MKFDIVLHVMRINDGIGLHNFFIAIILSILSINFHNFSQLFTRPIGNFQLEDVLYRPPSTVCVTTLYLVKS